MELPHRLPEPPETGVCAEEATLDTWSEPCAEGTLETCSEEALADGSPEPSEEAHREGSAAGAGAASREVRRESAALLGVPATLTGGGRGASFPSPLGCLAPRLL